MSRGSDLSWSHVLFPSLSPVNCVNRTTLRLLQHEQRTSGPQSRQSSIVEGEIRGIPVVNEEASVDAGAEMVLGEDTLKWKVPLHYTPKQLGLPVEKPLLGGCKGLRCSYEPLLCCVYLTCV